MPCQIFVNKSFNDQTNGIERNHSARRPKSSLVDKKNI